MRIYTAHLHPERAPVLVREGFAWGGLLLGPLWLALRRAWIPAALAAALALVIATAATGPLRPALLALLGLGLGVVGNDLRRFALARRGYQLGLVLAAGDEEGAIARLLAARPELAVRLR